MASWSRIDPILGENLQYKPPYYCGFHISSSSQSIQSESCSREPEQNNCNPLRQTAIDHVNTATGKLEMPVLKFEQHGTQATLSNEWSTSTLAYSHTLSDQLDFSMSGEPYGFGYGLPEFERIDGPIDFTNSTLTDRASSGGLYNGRDYEDLELKALPATNMSFVVNSISHQQADAPVDQPTPCTHPGCGKVFSGKHGTTNMHRHRRQKHVGKVNPIYACRFCQAVYMRSDSRLNHWRKRHPGRNRNNLGPRASISPTIDTSGVSQ